MKITIPYSCLDDGYHCKHNYNVDVCTTIELSKGKYVSSVAVYNKHVPVGLVLGLINSYKSLPELPTHITGLNNAYILRDNELVQYEYTTPEVTEEGYYAN